ncbi:MAG: hypothetical protein WCJ64_26895 [Rhodospirillaceae bacterium]
MSSISSSTSVASYLALPAPGAATVANARAGLPVQPVPPVTRRSGQSDETAGSDRAAERSGRSAVSGQSTGGSGGGGSSGASAPLTLKSPTQPSTGFLAQSLSQESLGSGLHIEPWSAALGSYRSAAALTTPATRSRGVVV